MIDIPYSEDYFENREKYPCQEDEQPCVICGKRCPNPKHGVHVHGGGDVIVTDAEAARLNPAGDLGFYPIGSDCLRRHPELQKYLDGGSPYDIDDLTPTSRLYTSDKRMAYYDWKPGCTRIILSTADVLQPNIEGSIEQGEKAEGICLRWIEAGEVSASLKVNSPI